MGQLRPGNSVLGVYKSLGPKPRENRVAVGYPVLCASGSCLGTRMEPTERRNSERLSNS